MLSAIWPIRTAIYDYYSFDARKEV